MRQTAGQQFRSSIGSRANGVSWHAAGGPGIRSITGGLWAVSAVVKHPNTPESDRETYVAHIVTMNDDTTRELMAADPGDAINRVNISLAHEQKGGSSAS